ncbi:hypothetical protein SAMN05192574_102472 [Mucilaginibacter gossypiicola]|uniref:Right handed beta helix region n=1 Tax=Mucilaginibacter gossypiicola TaxID=551995 RepID=A0A1H8DU19_9SPHI|nr:hypothetical protein [Mucilaginibacter gossypiicola]SEN10713.1 hypothetical protein SAMN05192574_102472 [Mucilaginibacter gossypiicola]
MTTIANYAALRSYAYTPGNESVFVEGYSTTGDGGQGTFNWDPSGTEADNDGTIIIVGSTTPGRWKRLYSGSIDLRWFGAKNDGSADVTSILNNVIAFADTVPSAISFIGSYLVNGTVNINNAVTLEGVSNQSVITGTGVLSFSSGSTGGTICGVTFTGARIAINCSDVTICNCIFNSINDNAIKLTGTNNNVLILTNTFTNINPTSDATFNSTGRAVYKTVTNPQGTSDQLRIINNLIDGINSGSCIFISGLSTNILITANIIKNTMGQGVEFYMASYDSTGRVLNNQFYGIGKGRMSGVTSPYIGGKGCNAIYAGQYQGGTGPFIGIDVAGNHIDLCYENGIEGAFNLISNNYVKDTGYDLINFPTESPEGIYDGHIITNNTIINPGKNGIYYATAGSITDRIITDNYIFNPKGTDSGINLLITGSTKATYSNCQIEGNIIDGFDNAIYLRNLELYQNVGLSSNEGVNCNYFFKDAAGFGLDLRNEGSIATNILQNQLFSQWTGTVPDNWTLLNGTILKVTDADNDVVPKITATDAFHGRLVQGSMSFPTLVTGNRFLLFQITAMGSADLLLRITVYNSDGTLSSTVSSFVTSGISSTAYTVYNCLYNIPSTHIQIEIGTSGVSGTWVQFKNIQTYFVDKLPH